MWLVGALVLGLSGFLCGPRVVGWCCVRWVLMQDYDCNKMTHILMGPSDLGVPSGEQLVELMDSERAEVRRAAAIVIAYDPQRVTPSMIEPFYRDEDGTVGDFCLYAGAKLGERDCVLALDELMRSADSGSGEYHMRARILVQGCFREAGDDIVRRFDTTTDERTRLLLVGRLQRLLCENGFVADRGVLIEGEFIRCGGPDSSPGKEKLEKLFKELVRIWGLKRSEYRSVQDFRPGDRLTKAGPEQEPFGIGRRLVGMFLLGLVGLWSLLFWGVVLLKPAMARLRVRR